MSNLTPQTRCEHCERALGREGEFVCQHCSGVFCAEHRLPPKHNCPMLALWRVKAPPETKPSKGGAQRLMEKLRARRLRWREG